MSRLPAQLGSHVSSVWGFVRRGKGEEHESRKTRRLKRVITHFLSFTTPNVKPIFTRPMKTTCPGSITTQGHFVFLITPLVRVLFSSCTSPEELHRLPTWITHYFTRMCFPAVFCAVWIITEGTISENIISCAKE